MGLVEGIMTNYAYLPGYLLEAASVIIIIFLAYFLVEGYGCRSRIKKLRMAGIPIAEPYSIFAGHIRLLDNIKKKLPRDVHHAYIQMYLMKTWREFFPLEEHCCPPVIYLDLWPLEPSLAIVNDPELCAQTVTSLPRSWQSRFTVVPLTGGRDLGSSGVDIELHSRMRARYAPAFSLMNVTKNVAVIAEQASILSDCLRAEIGHNDGWGDIFSLEDEISAFVFDCLAGFAVGLNLNEQRHGHSALRSALYKQTANLLPQSLFTLHKRMNPFYHMSIWRNNKAIERILAPTIRSKLYSEIARFTTSHEKNEDDNERTVLDVIVKRLVSKNRAQISKLTQETGAFVDDALQNIKLFLLAGHDTTTATICFILEMLARNPKELAMLREEHDSVLEADYSQTSVREILQRPEKLRNLPFTLAVIKESLRLCPLATTVRQGNLNFTFDIKGNSWPTDGFHIQTGVWNIHNDSTYWPRVGDFVPNRWLVIDKDDPLFPDNKNAWRPFEHGPLNCVGLEFAICVIKIALVFVVREFDIESAWDGWDELRGDEGPKKDLVQGERLYRTEFNGGFFKCGMPVHLRRRHS